MEKQNCVLCCDNFERSYNGFARGNKVTTISNNWGIIKKNKKSPNIRDSGTNMVKGGRNKQWREFHILTGGKKRQHQFTAHILLVFTATILICGFSYGIDIKSENRVDGPLANTTFSQTLQLLF